MELLERDAALSALADSLEPAAAGRGRLVLVSGEAGVGKTALLRAFAATAQARGARLLWAACDDLLTPRPLGPIVDLRATVGPSLANALAEDVFGGPGSSTWSATS